ncbi:MAG: HAMP domain-containing sensor histidine kinase [Candidatus Lustribacter sp.]|jgi:signal transduction histidine kinase
MTHRLAFRTRLTLAYTAMVAIAVILLGTIAFLTVRVALVSAFETRLDTTVRTIRSIVDIHHGKLEDLQGDDLVQFQALFGQGLNGAVLRRDDSLMTSNLAAPPGALLAQLVDSVRPNGVVHVDRDGTSYVLMPIVENGARFGTILTWGSRGAYEDAERITLMALGTAGVVVIAAGAAAAGTLTRRMLRPVTELSAMMSEIEATDLGERLVWKGPDDELGRLCSTFDRLLDRLETAFQRERRFIADASHELRTPLSVLRAEVELALMQDRTPEAYRSALQRLQRETQRLETLAESLILTTREDARPLAAGPVPAGEVAACATAHMQPLAASRGIGLTFAGAPAVSIEADADMLERAIVALIDNALRFAREDVSVAVTSDETQAVIAVRDDGPGFSPDALRDATSRFWRDDPARSGAGTGLGLAIARSIAERHHGSLALRNASGGLGAVVVITVPIAKSGVIA